MSLPPSKYSLSASKHLAATTLTQFPDLPPEVREMVWTYVSHFPRNLDIWVKHEGPELTAVSLDGQRRSRYRPHSFITSQCVPALLHTNREARTIGLKYYRLCFHTTCLHSTLKFEAKIYRNYLVDRLCLMGENTYEILNHFYLPSHQKTDISTEKARLNEINGIGKKTAPLSSALNLYFQALPRCLHPLETVLDRKSRMPKELLLYYVEDDIFSGISKYPFLFPKNNRYGNVEFVEYDENFTGISMKEREAFCVAQQRFKEEQWLTRSGVNMNDPEFRLGTRKGNVKSNSTAAYEVKYVYLVVNGIPYRCTDPPERRTADEIWDTLDRFPGSDHFQYE